MVNLATLCRMQNRQQIACRISFPFGWDIRVFELYFFLYFILWIWAKVIKENIRRGLCSVRGVCSLCHLACWVYILLLIMSRQQTTKKRHGEPEQIKRDLLLFRWKNIKRKWNCLVKFSPSTRLGFYSGLFVWALHILLAWNRII